MPQLRLVVLLGTLLYPLQSWARECTFESYWNLPITYNRHMPTVPITINDRNVVIGLDTGATNTVISKEGAEILGLKTLDYKEKVTGIGQSQSVNTVLIPSIEFAGITLRSRAIPLVDLPQNAHTTDNPDTPPAPPLIGLLGVDFLYLYDIEYNMSTQTITLYKVQGCHGDDLVPWRGNYTRVTGNYAKPNQLNIPVILEGMQMNAVFDTGASGTLISTRVANKVGVTKEMLENDPEGHGTGVGSKPYNTRIHTFSTLTIGNETLKDFPIAVTDSAAFKSDMLLGEDFMKTHRFWISYHTQSLFIQPVGQ